jgi:hypothetical protein
MKRWGLKMGDGEYCPACGLTKVSIASSSLGSVLTPISSVPRACLPRTVQHIKNTSPM